MTPIPAKNPQSLRVLFWNVRDVGCRGDAAYEAQRLERVGVVLKEGQADVVLLTEIRDTAADLHLRGMLGAEYGSARMARGSRGPWFLALFNKASFSHVECSAIDLSAGVKNWDGARFPVVEVTTPRGKTAIMSVHTKSGANEAAFGIRKQILANIRDCAAHLAARNADLLAVGDFNTMGIDGHTPGTQEVSLTAAFMAEQRGNGAMVRLPKSHEITWMGIDNEAQWPLQSLDHAFISAGARDRVVPVTGDPAEPVFVGGWPTLCDAAAREQWVRDYSDHAYIIADLQR